MIAAVVRRQFSSLLERDDRDIDLAFAALLVAREEYPTMDPRPYLARLDDLARQAAARALAATTVRQVVDAINRVLFADEGLRGNSENYYDPRNSYLNDVLDRKLGIPISLSIIYLAISDRLGVPMVGIGLPGHFIVRVQTAEQILIDPFHQGAVLSIEDCAARVREVYGGRVAFQPTMLEVVSKREILTRLLTNLKVIYAHADDFARLLAIIDRLLLIKPDQIHEFRDRGAVCQQLEFHGQALADLQRYVQLAPHAKDVDQVRQAIRSIQQRLAWQN